MNIASKFFPGDYFRAVGTANCGVVMNVKMEQRGILYGIVWAHICPAKLNVYYATDVDPLWESVTRADYEAQLSPLANSNTRVAKSVPAIHAKVPAVAYAGKAMVDLALDEVPGRDEIMGKFALTECNHQMTPYIGFTQSFNFCTKCDHKTEIPK